MQHLNKKNMTSLNSAFHSIVPKQQQYQIGGFYRSFNQSKSDESGSNFLNNDDGLDNIVPTDFRVSE
jgi:hypothetical protein